MEVQEAYGNIEKIITYGFLPLGLRYKDYSFLLKTVGDKEYRFLLFLGGNDRIHFGLNRMAFSTLLINGVNYLVDRDKKIQELINFYSKLPVSFFKILVDKADEMYRLYIDSLDYLEGFVYTPQSRHLWSAFGENTGDLSRFYGISGGNHLGINSVQENWIVMNKRLDEEEKYEVDFKLSLMIASSFAGKGAKELGSKFDFQKKELEELRKDIVKYGYDKNRIIRKKKEEVWAKPIRTSEDLVRELNRQMSGDKDKHDLFIERWIKNQKERAESAMKSAEKKQREFRENLQLDINELNIEPSRIATPEDIERVKQSIKGKKQGLSIPLDAYSKSNENEDVIKKVSNTVIGPKKG